MQLAGNGTFHVVAIRYSLCRCEYLEEAQGEKRSLFRATRVVNILRIWLKASDDASCSLFSTLHNQQA